MRRRTLRAQAFWNVLGRLRPGVSVDQAQAEFDALSAQLAREYPQTNAAIGAQVVPLRAHLVGSLRDVLPLLLGAAAILLIVACANVANLLLARGAARGREFAVRQALGASRARLVRQMLVESLLLATAGGVRGPGPRALDPGHDRGAPADGHRAGRSHPDRRARGRHRVRRDDRRRDHRRPDAVRCSSRVRRRPAH